MIWNMQVCASTWTFLQLLPCWGTNLRPVIVTSRKPQLFPQPQPVCCGCKRSVRPHGCLFNMATPAHTTLLNSKYYSYSHIWKMSIHNDPKMDVYGLLAKVEFYLWFSKTSGVLYSVHLFSRWKTIDGNWSCFGAGNLLSDYSELSSLKRLHQSVTCEV